MDGYVKPLNSMQDKLTNEDIEILLEEYNEVEDITLLKPGIHIRYWSIIKKPNGGEQKIFRMGGTIIKIDPEYKYIVLSSNQKLTWSVQVKDCIFYKKMTIDEVKQFYENELDNSDAEIKKYKLQIEKLKSELKEVKSINVQLINELKQNKKNFKKSSLLN